MLPSLALTTLAGFGLLHSVVAEDTYCSADVPCEIGCCGKNNVCGLGPNYCGKDTCINSCHAKAECNPGDWDNKYVNATTCPLNVCCSDFGFCGTTEEFCGNETVTRPSCDSSSQHITRVIGYYNSAAANRPCGGMIPQSIPQGVYSHLYFAFVGIDPTTFEVIPASEGDKLLYPQLKALQGRDLGQELWLSIGGWEFSDVGQPTATTFSDLVGADSKKQNAFFLSLINFMTTWGFTGIDIDWEYPVADDRNGRLADYKNFPKFMANLKKALSDYKFGLSVTLPTSYWYLQYFDLKLLDSSVDWFNFMSYDLHGTWDIGNKWTGAYLDAHTNLTEIKSALDLLWRNDIKPSKVTMGMAFYGRSVTLASLSCINPGCTYLSAGDKGDCSDTAGVLFNNEIAQIISDNNITPTLSKDAAVKTITWNNDQWVSYDDEETWRLKAEFAKSECLGGVLVWSVDNDDRNHTFSNGLAAALGNQINLNTTTGLSRGSFIEKSASSNSEKGQEQYCRFINCGEVCPSGFTEITRADKTKDLMLDSTTCPPGHKQTQTLCCPTSTDTPKCQWRGFHNNGKCKGGCNSDEVEIGTVGAGCKSGYQSACCTITDSVRPWTECQWTDSCHDDLTCPVGYPNFVVSSRDGWGGRKSCKKGKNFNYCCKGDTGPPDAFTDCNWHGHGVTLRNEKYCTTNCPAGSIRIAEQVVSTLMGDYRTAQTPDCLYGNEAYCCLGKKKKTVTSRGEPPTIYQDQTAREFDAYLKKFLDNPVCPAGWDSQYSPSFGLSTRELTQREKPTDQGVVLTFLLPMMATLITSQYPREDLRNILTTRLTEAGYPDAGNVTTLQDTFYGGVDSTTGTPICDPMALLAGYFCNVAHSSDVLQGMQVATETLCVDPEDGLSSLTARRVTVVTTNDRSSNNIEPSLFLVLNGIMNGDLSLHYLRWIQGTGRTILEMAFWIGPRVGVTPSAQLHDQYADRSHTGATDRWIVIHLHIHLDQHTFEQVDGNWYPGVTTMDLYHSQTITRPPVVTRGRTPAYRAEYRFSTTYADGSPNTGEMRNYNARTQALSCDIRRMRRWYIGVDRVEWLRTGERQGTRRPTGHAELINRFGLWIHRQGVFSIRNLQRLWPTLGQNNDDGDGWEQVFNARNALNPEPGAFDNNWLPDGSPAPRLPR